MRFQIVGVLIMFVLVSCGKEDVIENATKTDMIIMSEDCEPEDAWVGSWWVTDIEGMNTAQWLFDERNMFITNDDLVGISQFTWTLSFHANKTWYTTIHGRMNFPDASQFSTITFGGTYEVTNNTYELVITEEQSDNNYDFNLSAFTKLVKSQEEHWSAKMNDYCLGLKMFGKVTVNQS